MWQPSNAPPLSFSWPWLSWPSSFLRNCRPSAAENCRTQASPTRSSRGHVNPPRGHVTCPLRGLTCPLGGWGLACPLGGLKCPLGGLRCPLDVGSGVGRGQSEHKGSSVGFHNLNLRIFNLKVSNPNKLIVDVFLFTRRRISMCQALGPNKHDEISEIDRRVGSQQRSERAQG